MAQLTLPKALSTILLDKSKLVVSNGVPFRLKLL